eukprot:5884468-Pleurochrysis_carterae.AAC.1
MKASSRGICRREEVRPSGKGWPLAWPQSRMEMSSRAFTFSPTTEMVIKSRCGLATTRPHFHCCSRHLQIVRASSQTYPSKLQPQTARVVATVNS